MEEVKRVESYVFIAIRSFAEWYNYCFTKRKPFIVCMYCNKGTFSLELYHTCMCMYIIPTMLTELLYTLQYGDTPLHRAARIGHTPCVEHLLSIPDIDVNSRNMVSQSIKS